MKQLEFNFIDTKPQPGELWECLYIGNSYIEHNNILLCRTYGDNGYAYWPISRLRYERKCKVQDYVWKNKLADEW